MTPVESLLVEPVAHLVEHREHATGEVAEIEAEPDAAVAGSEAGAAGVDAEIEPAPREVEAHRPRRPAPRSLRWPSSGTARRSVATCGRGLASAIRAASGTSSRRSASNSRPTIALVMPGS